MSTVQVPVSDDGEVVREVADRAARKFDPTWVAKTWTLGLGTIYGSLEDLAYPGDQFYVFLGNKGFLAKCVEAETPKAANVKKPELVPVERR